MKKIRVIFSFAGEWLSINVLWLVGLCLMVASSGIDGAYMAKWMPPGQEWMGYVLNTTADVSGMVLTFTYGRLQQSRSQKKQRLSRVLLGAEVVAVAYSWFFSAEQLYIVMQDMHPRGYWWISIVSAGFIPLLLAFIGYAESLIVGRMEGTESVSRDMRNKRNNSAKQAQQIETPGATAQQQGASETQQDETTPRNKRKQGETKKACVLRLLRNGETNTATVAKACECSAQYARSLK